MLFARNLLRNKTRTAMTLFGAAIGIAVYVTTTAIIGDMQRQTQAVIAGYNTEVMVQRRGASTPLTSFISPEDFSALHARFGENVVPLVVGSRREDWNSYVMILGTTPQLVSRFGLIEGKAPVAGRREVMVGALISQHHGFSAGKDIPLGDVRYRVAGVFSVGSRLLDGGVMMDLGDAQKLLGREGQINLAMIRLSGVADAGQLATDINSGFPRLEAVPAAELVANIRLFKTVEIFSKAVGMVSFLGACLVVTNTLLMAVSERTREIGIFMAVGWSPFRVLRMLLAESVALCLGGAVAGNGLALLLLHLLNRSKSVGLGWLPSVLPPESVAVSCEIALLLACIAVIWPAVILYRFSPAEALRHE
jgi:ABC-type antimicrobial peptide transport system permease subunit